ncbi:MAG: peptidoglycan-binding protein [Desulfobacterales bacterium C00003060]|nr:MAG: peptidoglycan-binding protein [Desulfobacterales bacterium C00003060]
MPETTTRKKERLKLTPCKVSKDGTVEVVDGKSFEVMLNPLNYKRDDSICYKDDEAQGQSASNLKFNVVKPPGFSFDVILDGTGVVDQSAPEVKDQIRKLKDIFAYSGEELRPLVTKVLWGTTIFFGCLTSMSVDYTLFKPSGEPLRAKVTLAFTEFMSQKEESLRANRKSADLTHVVEVRAGDTLPLMCKRIYKDSGYYTQVARLNNITNFRDIKPGTRLFFPPLR